MPRPRSVLVNLADTQWYHCVSRCVRRTHLCGVDRLTGMSYEHRRGWIAQRIKQLAAIFAIDVAAYAVMTNHYHVVIHVDPQRAAAWSEEEVLRRWRCLFRGPLLLQRDVGRPLGQLPPAETTQLGILAATYRRRLADLSWFMRVLNESIARRANAEDDCSGRFWEGRFKSQALLDQRGILAAMVYVDLNPIRAGMSNVLEASDFTSIQERLGCSPTETPLRPKERAAGSSTQKDREPQPGARVSRSRTSCRPASRRPSAPLMPFDATGQTAWAIPFGLQEYVELVEWAGRGVHPEKRGHTAAGTPAMLTRLAIAETEFVAMASHSLKEFGSAIGAPSEMIRLCVSRQWKFLRGIRLARRLFESRHHLIPH